MRERQSLACDDAVRVIGQIAGPRPQREQRLVARAHRVGLIGGVVDKGTTRDGAKGRIVLLPQRIAGKQKIELFCRMAVGWIKGLRRLQKKRQI